MLKRVLNFLKAEPAQAYVSILGTLAALAVVAWKLDSTQAGYLSSIVTAAGSVIVGVLAKPRHLAVIPGAIAAVMQALVLFHVHVPSALIAAGMAAVNLILGYLIQRPQLEPVVNAKLRQQARAGM